MIILYSGIPGSGKTYKLVSDLYDQRDKFFVVHNITGLSPTLLGDYGINFVDYCQREQLDVVDFFSKDYQVKFSEAVRDKYGRNCLVIVDEAQEWFDKIKSNLKMWLSYHRHLNQDIWLVAHRSTNLPSVYRSYIELEYRAKSGSILCLPGYFFYNRVVAGERIGYVFSRKRKAIFDLYISQSDGFKKRRPSFFLIFFILVVIVGVSLFVIVPQRVIGGKSAKKLESVGKSLSVKSSGLDVDSGVISLGDCRYVGMVGDRVYLDLDGRVFALDELPEKYVVLQVTSSFVFLYDVQNRKDLFVRFFAKSSDRTPEIRAFSRDDK